MHEDIFKRPMSELTDEEVKEVMLKWVENLQESLNNILLRYKGK